MEKEESVSCTPSAIEEIAKKIVELVKGLGLKEVKQILDQAESKIYDTAKVV